METKLSILVCGITNRTDSLHSLLFSLEKQAAGKPVEIISLVDNKKMKIGTKRNRLIEMSRGDYVCFVDDDDEVSDDYVDSILEKTQENKDLILFRAMRFENGKPDRVCVYDLNIDRDYDTPEAYYRLPNHLMAYKKEIVKNVKYEDSSFREDSYWSISARSHVNSHSTIDKVLYRYKYNTESSESKKNYLFSVVIPTIWSSPKIHESLQALVESYAIGEIILINNRPEATQKLSVESPKIKEITPGTNIYVNPAWNLGVSVAKHDKVCLLNDDVVLEDMAFHFLTLQLERPDVGIVGLAKSCYDLSNAHVDYRQRNWFLEKIDMRNRGYGCALFFKKENYVPVPDDLKIWFGDDWLIKQNEGKVFRVHGPKIWADISQSVSSPEVQEVINSDVRNSLKYQLPWSNDYDL